MVILPNLIKERAEYANSIHKSKCDMTECLLNGVRILLWVSAIVFIVMLPNKHEILNKILSFFA